MYVDTDALPSVSMASRLSMLRKLQNLCWYFPIVDLESSDLSKTRYKFLCNAT